MTGARSRRVLRRLTPMPGLLGPHLVPACHVPPGSDLDLYLDEGLSDSKPEERPHIYALAIAASQGARTVHVRGGPPDLRRRIAIVLAASHGRAGAEDVTWDSPRRHGPAAPWVHQLALTAEAEA